MGRLRKVLVGAVAALATLAAGLVGAGSANAAGSETIELQPAASGSSLSATNYKAYKIVGYTPNTTSGTATSVTPVKVSDALENAIAKAMNDANPLIAYTAPTASNPTPNGAAEGVLLNLTSSDSSTLSNVARELSNQPASTLGSAIPGVQGMGANAANVEFRGLDPGLYLIVDSQTSGASLPILVSSTINGEKKLGSEDIGSAKVKTSATYKPTKSQTANSNDPTGAALDAGTYTAVGDTAHFKITMTVPDNANYKAFELVDTPTGYQIDHGSLHVYVQDGSATPTNITTSVNTTGSAYPLLRWSGNAVMPSQAVPDGGFILEDHQFKEGLTVPSDGIPASWVTDMTKFNANSIIHLYHGQTLIVTYDAKVTSPNAANAIGSIVTDFQGKSGGTPGETTHNGGTYGEPLAKFTKVEAAHRTVKLSGVTFTLKNAAGQLMAPTTVTIGSGSSAVTHKGWKPVAAPASGDPTSEAGGLLTTDNNGDINLDGLTSGTYTLHEVALPTDESNPAHNYLHPTPGVTSTDITITVGHNATGATISLLLPIRRPPASSRRTIPLRPARTSGRGMRRRPMVLSHHSPPLKLMAIRLCSASAI